jgi:hypothetical protein
MKGLWKEATERKTLKKQTKIVADGLYTAKSTQGRAEIRLLKRNKAKHSHVGEIGEGESDVRC